MFWDECIQDYDCHLADYTDDQEKITVSRLWGPLLTECLIDFVSGGGENAGRGPIRYVYDLLSEGEYQATIEWERLASRNVKVYHRAFRDIGGPDILVPLAQLLAKNLPRFVEGPGQFQRGEWYSEPGIPAICFEPRIDTDSDVEGLVRIRRDLRQTRPGLRDVPDGCEWFPRLALAELSWSRAEHLRSFDWGALIVDMMLLAGEN